MSDAIAKALREAREAVRKALVKPPCCMEGTGCELPPCHCSQVAAAAAVSVFLRALPDRFPLPGAVNTDGVPCQSCGAMSGWHTRLAAAVERAAQGGSNGG
jgi:hypothetical protein